jgi:hypothetical protein
MSAARFICAQARVMNMRDLDALAHRPRGEIDDLRRCAVLPMHRRGDRQSHAELRVHRATSRFLATPP